MDNSINENEAILGNTNTDTIEESGTSLTSTSAIQESNVDSNPNIDTEEFIGEILKEITEKGEKGEYALPLFHLVNQFGYQRSRASIKAKINQELLKRNLITDPPISQATKKQTIFIRKKPPQYIQDFINTTYKVEILPAATQKPVFVTGGDPLAKAVTLMLVNDFSQLPVFNNTNLDKPMGFISWKTIGEKFASNNLTDTQLNSNSAVSHFIKKEVAIISKKETLFNAIHQVVKHDFLLIQDDIGRKEIVGIVTTSDLTAQFEILAKPFLLVSEIENGIRQLLNMANFSSEKLGEAKFDGDTRTVSTVDDLSFAEYITLISKNWDDLGITWLDKTIFIAKLHEVRELRNDIMHFNPDGLDEEDIRILDEFSNFLKNMKINRKTTS